MRRITIWITATLAVVALAIAYQLNATTGSGKSGEETRNDTSVVEPGSTPAPSSPSSEDPAKGGGDTETHEDKPGESK